MQSRDTIPSPEELHNPTTGSIPEQGRSTIGLKGDPLLASPSVNTNVKVPFAVSPINPRDDAIDEPSSTEGDTSVTKKRKPNPPTVKSSKKTSIEHRSEGIARRLRSRASKRQASSTKAAPIVLDVDDIDFSAFLDHEESPTPKVVPPAEGEGARQRLINVVTHDI
ncbi:hypothetical protein H6P81_006421 [Aristolochia fimbriata]|uniref:Uncharacterized protein n=1 Tax=Aristolochia fimbriata TaxID=158543 RepID=A0AAV7EXE7_ARIFI|nr:hypothetical protein H6P81_006421 [Aristolochia fimbriata]